MLVGGGKVVVALETTPAVTPLEAPLQIVELDLDAAIDCEAGAGGLRSKGVVLPCCEGEYGRFVNPADCCKALVISAAARLGFKEPNRCADAKRFGWCC